MALRGDVIHASLWGRSLIKEGERASLVYYAVFFYFASALKSASIFFTLDSSSSMRPSTMRVML